MIRFPLFKQQKGRMPMDTHESDCVIVYEETADLFDQRRASRVRFAAANLPILLGVWILAWILFWLYNQASISGKTTSGLQIGGAMTVFVLAIYRLLHYQNLWLERRCNDAGKAWDTAEYVKKISFCLAIVGMVLPTFALPIVFGGLFQFIFGMLLPGNRKPNISGATQPDTPALCFAAVLSFVVAFAMLIWIFL